MLYVRQAILDVRGNVHRCEHGTNSTTVRQVSQTELVPMTREG